MKKRTLTMREIAELILANPADPVVAEEIIRNLPPDSYGLTFQPDYPNQDDLIAAMRELRATQPVTTPENIRTHASNMAKIATREIISPIVTGGPCAEQVDAHLTIEEMVDRNIVRRALIIGILGDFVTYEGRECGQVFKPRSSQMQEITVGDKKVEVYSLMGPGINDIDPMHRMPDPTRLVATAVQSRDISNRMLERLGFHSPKAHEALSLPYELPFMQVADDGKIYLLSADKPWIGQRTNDPDGLHVALLSCVANPVGVKIGVKDATKIRALEAALNPDNIPGKVTYMVRVGNDIDAASTVLMAIKEYVANPLIQFDIHGSTEDKEGTKVRTVGNVIQHIKRLAIATGGLGLHFSGVHLETTHDNRRLECVDHPWEMPTHPGFVDPGLNPRQLSRVLTETREYLLR